MGVGQGQGQAGETGTEAPPQGVGPQAVERRRIVVEETTREEVCGRCLGVLTAAEAVLQRQAVVFAAVGRQGVGQPREVGRQGEGRQGMGRPREVGRCREVGRRPVEARRPSWIGADF